MTARIPAHVREQQINDLPNITFVRWDGEYRNNRSRAVCHCDNGHEWGASVNSLLKVNGHGCPKCAVDKQRKPREQCEQEINKMDDVRFVRWDGEYRNSASKAVVRCTIDGHMWSAIVNNLLSFGTGCPKCAAKTIADKKRKPRQECEQEIDNIPGVMFICWKDEYRGARSYVTVQCTADGHEWDARVGHLLHSGTGCPKCAVSGYNPSKHGTLYALLSECRRYVKIGISNDYKRRLVELATATPFAFERIGLIHGDGAYIASLEKQIHSMTEQALFNETFNGYTEWRKWDSRVLEWFKMT